MCKMSMTQIDLCSNPGSIFAVWLWVNYLTSMSLHVLMYVRRVICLTSQVAVSIKLSNVCMSLFLCLSFSLWQIALLITASGTRCLLSQTIPHCVLSVSFHTMPAFCSSMFELLSSPEDTTLSYLQPVYTVCGPCTQPLCLVPCTFLLFV